MSYSRTQAQSAASTAKTQMGGQSQKSQSGPEALPPDSKFEPFPVYTITTLTELMARYSMARPTRQGVPRLIVRRLSCRRSKLVRTQVRF